MDTDTNDTDTNDTNTNDTNTNDTNTADAEITETKIFRTTDRFKDFTNAEITKILDVACVILQEVIPVELENDVLSDADVDLYNDMVDQNAVYPAMSYPARKIWIDTHPAEDFDFLLDSDIAKDFVEVYFYFSAAGRDEDGNISESDTDPCFAVVLMPKPWIEDDYLKTCVAVEFFPDDEFLNAGFKPLVLDIPADNEGSFIP